MKKLFALLLALLMMILPAMAEQQKLTPADERLTAAGGLEFHRRLSIFI